jgi:hypothetical protein
MVVKKVGLTIASGLISVVRARPITFTICQIG